MSKVATGEVRAGWQAQVLATSQRVTQWTFAALRLVLLLACVFLVSWVVNYNPLSWDLTQERLFSISAQTRAVIAGLEQPVNLTAFVEGGRDAAVGRVLTAYSEGSRLVSHRLVDPEGEPALAAEHQVRDYGTLIVEGAGRVHRAETITEPAITNAILAVTRGAAVPVCFLTGHGERSPGDQERTGLSAAATALAQTNYEVRALNLLAEGEVPGECRVVVAAGPTSDILPAEREALERFLDGDGRLLAMLESQVRTPELAAVLARYGVTANDDFVIDTGRNAQAFGGGIQVPMVDAYQEHPITESFRLMTMYNMPRSFGTPEEAPAGLDVRVLATSSRSSWGETNYERGKAATWDEGLDLAGPLPLVVAVGDAVEETPQAYRARMRAGEPAPVGDPHLVAVGDVDFVSNSMFAFQGDGDLFLNSVSWLAGQQELISIRPKQVANRRIVLTDGQKGLTFVLLVILLPVIPAVAGFVTMVKRVK